MPRQKAITKEPKKPDLKYKSRVVTKLIAMVMKDGKKSIARKIVYDAIESLNSDDEKEARNYFEEAVKNVMPDVEVRTRRIGGANYQIPVPVKYDRSETLALRWLINAARSKKGSPMAKKLSEELRLAYKNEGMAIKKKINTKKMANANRAFAHFRF